MQDVCVKIPPAGSCRSTGARSVCEDLLRKMSASRSPQQDPVGALAQDQCMRISCARCCVKSQDDPVGPLRRQIFVCGPLAQDHSVRMSASRPGRTTCARSLYVDLLSKISLAGSLHQDPVGPLAQDLCMRISCARSLCQDLCIRVL